MFLDPAWKPVATEQSRTRAFKNRRPANNVWRSKAPADPGAPGKGVGVVRQIWITRAGPPEVLQVKEAADPAPKAGEVRIRVEASGVNFADIMGRMGVYPD